MPSRLRWRSKQENLPQTKGRSSKENGPLMKKKELIGKLC